MRCVRCRQPMLVFESNDVEADHCPSCGGIWLDAGELEILLKGPMGQDPFVRAVSAAPADKDPVLACPICGALMHKLRPERGVSTLDRCAAGHGFWFDRGELGEVLRLAGVAGGGVERWLTEIFPYESKQGGIR